MNHNFLTKVADMLDPDAGKHPIFAEINETQQRIANDPSVQMRRKQVAQEIRHDMKPGLVIGILVILAACAAAWYFVPGLVDVTTALIMGVTCSAIFAMAWNKALPN